MPGRLSVRAPQRYSTGVLRPGTALVSIVVTATRVRLAGCGTGADPHGEPRRQRGVEQRRRVHRGADKVAQRSEAAARRGPQVGGLRWSASKPSQWELVIRAPDDAPEPIEFRLGGALTIDGAAFEVENLDEGHAQDLLGDAALASATAFDTGALQLRFEGGLELVAPVDPKYEGWTATAPGGFLTVSMPGGELATWST